MVVPQELSIAFVEAGNVLAETTISTDQEVILSFGSDRSNNIVVQPTTGAVAPHHGEVVVHGGRVFVRETGSRSGLYLNGRAQTQLNLRMGDIVSIGQPAASVKRTVIVAGEADKRWSTIDLTSKSKLTIGRQEGNDLVIPNPTVSAQHAVLARNSRGAWTLSDLDSFAGTRVDGAFLRGPYPLLSGCVLMFGNAQVVFLGTCLLVMVERRGVEVVGEQLVRYRTNRGVRRITTDHISVRFGRGEFVALVGGSGCGKSTLLNELNGSEPADEGSVTVDGIDLYANFDKLKCSIGYVPQQDIVYDDLRLEDMLAYAARLKMPPDTTAQERATRVDEVIDLLELGHVRTNFIGKLSGGQKKRASIAVELLADPRLLFLDEPTSGLDPGIERKLMIRLAEMAHEGRTIILVTHTTLNLHLCNQVVFLGSGGKLCYAGDPQGVASFFGVTDYVEVYPKIEDDPEQWERKFLTSTSGRERRPKSRPTEDNKPKEQRRTGFLSQFLTLSARYAKLTINDWPRLLLMVGQAPLLAVLINLVAGEGVFDVCEDTKFCLFALSCAAFWVGIFDSIQEICKEVGIFTREYGGGMRLSAYIASKMLVLGALCLVQTILLVTVLIAMMGMPKEGLISAPLELVVSTYLTVLSAMCLGLLVSGIFRSPSGALAVAPLLIMPQILFSGIAFELNDVTEKISYAINCRWAIEALGTTANLNELDLAIYGETIEVPEMHKVLENQTIEVPETHTVLENQAIEVPETETEVQGMKVTVPAETRVIESIEVDVPAETRTFESIEVDVPKTEMEVDHEMIDHEPDDMFDHTLDHLFRSWAILAGFSVACVVGCLGVLRFQVRR